MNQDSEKQKTVELAAKAFAEILIALWDQQSANPNILDKKPELSASKTK